MTTKISADNLKADIAISTTGNVDVSSGTLTLANDQISGDKISGGTISTFASTGIDDNATSTAITIDSSEKVGINSTTPSSDVWIGANGLVIKETSGDGGIGIISSSATNNGNIAFTDSSGGSFSDIGGLITYLHNGDSFRFMTANAERMRLNSTGLGIGTSSPNAKLQVDGTLSVRSSSSQTFNDSVNANNLTMNDSKAHFNLDGIDKDFQVSSDTITHALFIEGSSGNVGIGTSLPTRPLDIQTSNNLPIRTESSATINYLQQTNSTGTTYIASTGDDFFISTGSSGTERMRIDSSGFVGVGLTNPTAKLHVNTNSTGRSNVYFSNFNTSGGISSQEVAIGFQFNRTGGGINVSGARIVAGKEREWIGAASNQDGFLAFETCLNESVSEKMRIDSSGNVGIGETAPLGKLDVNGSIYCDGLQVDGNAVIQQSTGDVSLTLAANENGSNREPSFNLKGYNSSSNPIINFGDNNGYPGSIEYENADNSMRLYTNTSERMRIHSNGHVAIGTTASTADLELETTEKTSGTNLASGGICLRNSGTVNAEDVLPITARFVSSAEPRAGIGFIAISQDGIPGYGGAIGFYTLGSADGAQLTNSHERMRIDKSGNVLVGGNSSSFPLNERATKIFGSNMGISHNTSNNSGDSYIRFGYNTSTIGSITQSGTTAVAYNTSSDYRLKENVNYDFDATTRLKQLKPARFNFIADANTTVDGFIAHEVQDVVPEAISGEKDAVDENGNPVYQGIDQSKLVPLLVKTIQELEARITALETNNP